MRIKEHDNNIYTKEYGNNKLEAYLKSIIDRYFQIENDISQESKEAIIIQAYTRLKEIFNGYKNQFIICINERSGAIDLSIRDFFGEEKFDKNTAFNKDFCDVTTETKTAYNNQNITYNNFGEEQADHIVMGNDDRLHDLRIPLAHVHTIDEIDGLRERIEQYHILEEGFHLHNNFNILQMIKYVGLRTSIDLLLVEDLAQKVDEAVERFTETNEYIINTGKSFINQLQDILGAVTTKLEYVEENVASWINDFTGTSEIDTTIKVAAFKGVIKRYIYDYLSKDEYEELKKTLESAIRYNDQIIYDIKDVPFGDLELQSFATNAYMARFNGIRFDIKSGYTNLMLSGNKIINVTDNNILSKCYDNKINNSILKIYLEYVSGGVTYYDQLPHVYITNKNDNIYVYYETDSNNNLYIRAKRNVSLPVYFYQQLVINSYIEDYSGKQSELGYLVVDKDDTSFQSNNIQQDNNTKKLTDNTSGAFSSENITFNATARKNSPSDKYENECYLNWALTDPTKYNYKILKKQENDWIDLTESKAFSSSNTAVLQEVYDKGHIYRISGANVTEFFGSDKVNIWNVQSNGCLLSSVNASAYDVLLTDQYYGTYRHRATMTVGSNAGDNDVIAIVISAVKDSSGYIHTLSLLCDKAGEGHTGTGAAGCFLMYNYGSNTQAQITSFSYGTVNTSAWTMDTKISFDIRKDNKNLLIFASEMYTASGFASYNDNQVPNSTIADAKVTTTFAAIQSQTGIDFSRGMVGYGNFSQQGATLVGINLEVFNSFIDTEFVDPLGDTLNPKIPNIKARCTSPSLLPRKTNEIYEICIDYSDSYEEAQYKLGVFDEIDWLDDTPTGAAQKTNNALYMTNVISVTTFSGIEKVHYNFGYDSGDFTDHGRFKVLSESDAGNTKTITLEIDRTMLDDRFVFCDNGRHENTQAGIIQFLSSYNATPALIDTDLIKEYCESLVLLQDEYKRPTTQTAPYSIQYHTKNAANKYFNGKNVVIKADDVLDYYGELRYGVINDFLPNAKVYCQFFVAPGKGDPN